MGFSLGDAALAMAGGAAKVYNKDVEDRQAADQRKKDLTSRLEQEATYEKNMTGYKTDHARRTKQREVMDLANLGGGIDSDAGKYIALQALGVMPKDPKKAAAWFLGLGKSIDMSQYFDKLDMEEGVETETPEGLSNFSSTKQPVESFGEFLDGPTAKKEMHAFKTKVTQPTVTKKTQAGVVKSSSAFTSYLHKLTTPKVTPKRLDKTVTKDGTIVYTNPYTSEFVSANTDYKNAEEEPKASPELVVFNNWSNAADDVLKLIDSGASQEEIAKATKKKDHMQSILEKNENDTDIEKLNSAYNKAERKYAEAKAVGDDKRMVQVMRDISGIKARIVKKNAPTTETGAKQASLFTTKSHEYKEDLDKMDSRMTSIVRFEDMVSGLDKSAPGWVASMFGGVKRNFTGLAAGMNWKGYHALTLSEKKAELLHQHELAGEDTKMGLAAAYEQADAATLNLSYLLIGMYKELGLSRTNNQQIKDIKNMISSGGSQEALQIRIKELKNTVTFNGTSKIEYMYTQGVNSGEDLTKMAHRGVQWLKMERPRTADLSKEGVAFIRDNASQGVYKTKAVGVEGAKDYEAPKIRSFKKVMSSKMLTNPLRIYGE